MQGVTFLGLKDDSKIYSIGSLFRYNNNPTWRINLGLYPKQSKSHLLLSQTPTLARRRVLNQTRKNVENYEKTSFSITNAKEWEGCRIKDCPTLEGVNLTNEELIQNCFKFITKTGMTIYMPQFELARVLFFHTSYLSRTMMEPDAFKAEFDIQTDSENDSASIHIMPTCTFPINLLNDLSTRNLLSWILLDQSARDSYESINSFQMLFGIEKNNHRRWTFHFSPPSLENAELTCKGKLDNTGKNFFVYEITTLDNLNHHVPSTVDFFHHTFSEGGCEKEIREIDGAAEQYEIYSIDDDGTANSNNEHIIINTDRIKLGFANPFKTRKVFCNKKQGIYAKRSENIDNIGSNEVSTDEGSSTGENPRADFSTTDDISDDGYLYANRFDKFIIMLNQLSKIDTFEVKPLKIQKLPKVGKYRRHILKNGTPRCLAPAEIHYKGSQYILLELDKSGLTKSISTKLLMLKSPDEWKEDLCKIKELIVTGKLSWPKEELDLLCVEGGSKSISHNIVKNESPSDWASRISDKIKENNSG